jgi:hypothetical protein
MCEKILNGSYFETDGVIKFIFLWRMLTYVSLMHMVKSKFKNNLHVNFIIIEFLILLNAKFLYYDSLLCAIDTYLFVPNYIQDTLIKVFNYCKLTHE